VAASGADLHCAAAQSYLVSAAVENLEAGVRRYPLDAAAEGLSWQQWEETQFDGTNCTGGITSTLSDDPGSVVMHREFPVAASTCSSSDRRCWKSWRVTWKWCPLIPLLLLGVVCTHAQRQRHPAEISLASPMHADIKINESVNVYFCSHG